MIDNAPDPTETVRVLKSDFDLLQAAANAAFEDYQQWLELLGITAPAGKAPREVMYEMVFPTVVRLINTQTAVDESAALLRERASRFGNQTQTFAGGVQGLKVGQKVPGLFDPRPRRERRGNR